MAVALTRRQFLEIGAAAIVQSKEKPAVTPEYARTIEEALVSFPDASADTDPKTLSRFLEAAFQDLSRVLPSYTNVHLAARRESATFARERLHLVSDVDVEIELWAQDIGEPVLIGGKERFLVSRRMPPSMGAPGRMSRDRRRIAELVFGEETLIDAPFVFEGGNLAFDQNLVLIGGNDVSRTIAASGENSTRARVLEDVASAFGVDQAVEMGNESPSPFLQHLDQAFVLLEGRTAVACRLEGGELEAEARQLRTYAGQLQELGYRVSYLDHAAADLSGYRSSINVVPFFDRESGRKRVLLPVFPGELREDAKTVDRKGLLGKAAAAFDLYRDLGYEPSPLRDVTHALGGNTHCILNVLS